MDLQPLVVLQPFLGLVAFFGSKQDRNTNKMHQYPITVQVLVVNPWLSKLIHLI